MQKMMGMLFTYSTFQVVARMVSAADIPERPKVKLTSLAQVLTVRCCGGITDTMPSAVRSTIAEAL